MVIFTSVEEHFVSLCRPSPNRILNRLINTPLLEHIGRVHPLALNVNNLTSPDPNQVALHDQIQRQIQEFAVPDRLLACDALRVRHVSVEDVVVDVGVIGRVQVADQRQDELRLFVDDQRSFDIEEKDDD